MLQSKSRSKGAKEANAELTTMGYHLKVNDGLAKMGCIGAPAD